MFIFSLNTGFLRARRALAALAVTLSIIFASLAIVAAAPQAAHAVQEAQAAKGPAFKIPVMISSRTDRCYDQGDVAAIKHMALAHSLLSSSDLFRGLP